MKKSLKIIVNAIILLNIFGLLVFFLFDKEKCKKYVITAKTDEEIKNCLLVSSHRYQESCYKPKHQCVEWRK